VLQGHAEPIASSTPATATVYQIRRLRDFTYVTDEQVWAFFSRLEVLLQTGVGLSSVSTTQGHDPQIMLQWSDNNGRTWSNEHWVSAGKVGEYRKRALWRRLGRSRKRLFRVTVSDPVKWALIDAFLQIQRGTS